MQYSASIDDFARIMKDGNNGGYANTWLVADRKTNEMASLELGLKNVTLQRTRDGYFVGSNFPERPQAGQGRDRFRRERIKSKSDNARHARWLSLWSRTRARSTSPPAQRFLADHFDTSRARWTRASAPCAATSTFRRAAMVPGRRLTHPRARCKTKSPTPRMAENMTLTAALGHACGHRIQGCRAPAQAPRIRLVPARSAGYAVAGVDYFQRSRRAIRGWRAGLGQPA